MKTTLEKISHNTFICLFFLSIGLFSSQANAKQAPQIHDHQDIKQSAKQFLLANIQTKKYSNIHVQMGHLDSRLSLSQCDNPLTSSLAPGAQLVGKTTVHIRCNGNKPWTVYVTAQIKLYTRVIKTAEPLDKGHILSKEDLISAEEDVTRLHSGYFTNSGNLIGKQLKRRLPQNKLLKPNYVKSPTLVKRGELVSIIAKSTGYSVKMTGTAMMNGAKGERIRVKNSSSKRIIEGTVTQAGMVNIN